MNVKHVDQVIVLAWIEMDAFEGFKSKCTMNGKSTFGYTSYDENRKTCTLSANWIFDVAIKYKHL